MVKSASSFDSYKSEKAIISVDKNKTKKYNFILKPWKMQINKCVNSLILHLRVYLI